MTTQRLLSPARETKIALAYSASLANKIPQISWSLSASHLSLSTFFCLSLPRSDAVAAAGAYAPVVNDYKFPRFRGHANIFDGGPRSFFGVSSGADASAAHSQNFLRISHSQSLSFSDSRRL